MIDFNKNGGKNTKIVLIIVVIVIVLAMIVTPIIASLIGSGRTHARRPA